VAFPFISLIMQIFQGRQRSYLSLNACEDDQTWYSSIDMDSWMNVKQKCTSVQSSTGTTCSKHSSKLSNLVSLVSVKILKVKAYVVDKKSHFMKLLNQ